MRVGLVLLLVLCVRGGVPQRVTLHAVHALPVHGDWNQAYLELWEMLTEALNITLKVRVLESAWLPEASWVDLLNEIQNGSAQISLTPVTMLPATATNITFSVPVHRTSLSVLVRESVSERVRWSSFFEPFRRSLWLALLSSVLLLSLALAALWWLERGVSLSSVRCALPEMQLSEALICVLGASCLQGHPQPPRSASARIVHLLALVSAVVVVAVYSSSVTAFLAVTRDLRPFSSLDQLLTSSRFRPITIYGSPEHSLFQDSENVAFMRHRQRDPPSTLNSLDQALSVTCGRNTSLLGPWSRRVPALVISSLWAERALSVAPCPLLHISLTNGQPLWAAFPLAPGMPYKKLINNRLLRVIQAGAITRYSEYISLKKQLALERKLAEGTTAQDRRFIVELKDVAPLLALLGCGAIVAVFFLGLEFAARFIVTRHIS